MGPARTTMLAGMLGSLVLHGLALMLVGTPVARPSRPAVDREPVVPFDPTGVDRPGLLNARGTLLADAPPPVPGGRESMQNIDTRERGERGDARGSLEGILLMNRAEGVLLFDSPLNNLVAGQSQRIRTARSRATRERRRATPNPNDQAFLATGAGRHSERRPVSARDARDGARVAPTATDEGSRPATEDVAALADTGELAQLRAAAAQSSGPAGAEEASPGRGILRGRARGATEAARVGHGRPTVDRGPAATPSETRERRVRDDQDSELLARSMMQSWVEATARTAPNDGPGRGGVGGGGAPGVGGGRAEGGRAASHAPGPGDHQALDTSDRRYRRWVIRQRRRLQEALVFPHARMLSMDQGTSIFRVTLRRDGTLVAGPELVRTSGFDDLDAAAASAISEVLPFEPLPEDLQPEVQRFAWRIPVDFSNPMVR